MDILGYIGVCCILGEKGMVWIFICIYRGLFGGCIGVYRIFCYTWGVGGTSRPCRGISHFGLDFRIV